MRRADKVIFIIVAWIISMLLLIFCTPANGLESDLKQVAFFACAPVEQLKESVDVSGEERIPSEYTDKELLALLTMAEAEGESEVGKRLVIDTVLNRVDSKYFPNTIKEVIYQPHQFSSMWNGRVDRCEIRNDIYNLVTEEMDKRLDNDVVFFNTGNYSKYGRPLYQIGNHYFSAN